MNRAAIAAARYHTYFMLSRLYLEGLTADLLPYVNEIPELAEATPRPFNLDEAAAVHYGLFAHDIFPFESIFRDPSGLLGGEYAEQVGAAYERTGIPLSAEVDHIGRELAFLASLCIAESRALVDEEIETARFIEHQQSLFLRYHLLMWLSPFITALSFSGQQFYEVLGRLTLDLIYDHMLTFAEEGAVDSQGYPHQNKAEELLINLQDDRAGLKQIANFLVTPPLSGFFIGQSTITTLARTRQLPRGFGSRQQMLSNLLHSAAQYDLIPDLFQDLSSHADTWARAYEEQVLDFPELGGWIQPWLLRVSSTARALSEMRSLSMAIP